MHIDVKKDGYIKLYDFTAHDTQIFESLLTGTERETYADNAYKSKKRDEVLKGKHIKNRILERAYRNTQLTDQQKK